MEFKADELAEIANVRDQTRLSYSDLAEQYYGSRALGDELRSAMRTWKRNNEQHRILDPVGRLFGDTLRIPAIPTLVIGDTHAPYQNKDMLMAAFTMAKKRGVQQLVHAGDLVDAASYNSQAKHETVTPIETDIAHARSILYTAQTFFPKIKMVPGNHDFYYIKKTDMSFERFIKEVVLEHKYTHKFETTEFDYLFYDDFAVIGHLSSGYDVTPGKVAANIAQKYDKHALVGHDHLRGFMQADNGKFGISIGGAFQIGSFWYKERSYNTFPHSMLGFVIIENRHIWQYNEELREVQII